MVYFVHDLTDPAVHRRVRMFHAAGATVCLLGFHRSTPPSEVDGAIPVALGATKDARLWSRAGSVGLATLKAPGWRHLMAGSDVIVARQLEMLLLAGVAQRLHAPGVPLVFECLDVHRQMGTPGAVGGLLRALERRLVARCRALIVSSPSFVDQHFRRVHDALPPVVLIENKPLSCEFDLSDRHDDLTAARPGPPWRIGWFGMIRCARSLSILAELARRLPGRVEIVIRGRVALSAVPEFHAVVAETPGLRFGGPYVRQHDLPDLYKAVHFAWAIDFYEAGANSDWLLPNRLYEAMLFGAVPIACRNVATGAWLAARELGVLLDDDPTEGIADFIDGLDARGYAVARGGIAALAEDALVYDPVDCRGLVETIVNQPERGASA